jgi:hypothetical protein
MSKVSWVNFRNVVLCIALLVQVLTFLKHSNVSIFEGPTMRAPASLHSVARSSARQGDPSPASPVAFVAGGPWPAQADRTPGMRGGLPSGFESGVGGAAVGAPTPTGSEGGGSFENGPQGAPVPAPSEGHGRPEPTEVGAGESSGPPKPSGGGGSSAPPDGGGNPDPGGGNPAPAGEGGEPETSVDEERGGSPTTEWTAAELAPCEPGEKAERGEVEFSG